MSRVRIVTDSTADLPKDTLEQYGITVVPLKVLIDGEVYRDGVDLSPEEFYLRLPQAQSLPTTSQPSPGEFAAVFQELTANGDSVISIHLSGDLSGTVQSAQLASTMVDGDISVVDSRTVTMAMGLVVIAAAQAAQAGKTKAEILELIEAIKIKSKLYFIVDTFEYLQKGGRIGKVGAILGSLLNVKPILSIVDGIIAPVEKVRGENKAVEIMLQMAKEIASDGKIHCSVLHGNTYQKLTKLHERVVEEFNTTEIIISEISPVLGTHVGPGTFGMAFYVMD